MRVVTYTRVSSRTQDTALQQTALLDYCRSRGFEIAGQYTDTASGARADRPGLLAMMDAIQNGQADAVVVYKLDRLGRSLRDLIRIIDDLKALKVGLISVTDSIDTTTPAGMLMLHMVGAFAQFERDLINTRCSAGRAKAQAEGVRFGRPRRKVNDEIIVRKALAGIPIARIAREHKVSRNVVYGRVAEYKSLHPTPASTDTAR